MGAGCPAGVAVSATLQKDAEALPPTGATWHRAAHAIVSLARVAPADARLLLPRFVGHPTWQVRMYAARAAGQMESFEPLARLGADAHDNVREAAIEELARLKRAEALVLAYEALTRPDYQLVMTAARTLAAETDKAKATAALIPALERLTAQGHDTSRDPRVAILTTLTGHRQRRRRAADRALSRGLGSPRRRTGRQGHRPVDRRAARGLAAAAHPAGRRTPACSRRCAASGCGSRWPAAA